MEKVREKIRKVMRKIEDGEENRVIELKEMMIRYEIDEWENIYRYRGWIEKIAGKSENHAFACIYIASQICIHYFQTTVMPILQRIYSNGENEVKNEVIKAVIAVCEVNKDYCEQVNRIFILEDLLQRTEFHIVKQILWVFCTRELSKKEIEEILKSVQLLMNGEEVLLGLNIVSLMTEMTPYCFRYFSDDFLKEILENMLSDEYCNSCLKILGNYVVNVESAHLRLIAISAFDYLLQILDGDKRKDVLWIISNLITESNSVVELLVLNNGLVNIFSLLNANYSVQIATEIGYIALNVSKIANNSQVEYLWKAGIIDSIIELMHNGDESLKNILKMALNNYKKLCPKLTFYIATQKYLISQQS
jgi:hypothetical protein